MREYTLCISKNNTVKMIGECYQTGKKLVELKILDVRK